MSENKKDSNWVDDYISEVGTYSKDHMSHIDKFNSLLDKMKADDGGRRLYGSFKETVSEFEKFITKNKVNLTDYENSRLSVIISSGLNNAAKKRMAEDLIHKVRERHELEKQKLFDDKKRQKEIEELKKSGVGLVNWLRLTRFALDYGTITPFSHRLRSSSLNLIKSQGMKCFFGIEGEINSILNDLYYYISILEYNSLVKLSELGVNFKSIASLPSLPSYDPLKIAEEMDNFSGNYMILMNNISYVDRGLKKLLKERKPVHGFWGYLGILTGRPISNSKIIRYSEYDRMNKTILGTVMSYYTTRFKIPVRTANQVMFLISEDGLLNTKVKHLTEKAHVKMEKENERDKDDSSQIRERFEEISDIPGKFAEWGEKLAERIFQVGGRSNIRQWEKEADIKPFFKLGKVLDGYLKYLLDILADNQTRLEYDDQLIDNYFEKFSDLIKVIDNYHRFAVEIEGRRGKDLFNYKIVEGLDVPSFIENLVDKEGKLPQFSGARDMRETLNELSSRCYNLCLRFNDVINVFKREGKTLQAAPQESYDFYLNARLVHVRYNSVSFVLNRKEVSLGDILEAGCSLAVYVASFLNHQGIKSIIDEAALLREGMEGSAVSDNGVLDEERFENGSVDPEKEMLDDLDRMYRDSLTGLENLRYLEDVIIPGYYDEDGNYSGDSVRHLFCCSIVNLSVINSDIGNEAGDRALKSLTALFNDRLGALEGKSSMVIRYDGTLFVGFIVGLTTSQCVDLLRGIAADVSSGESGGGDVIVNFGIYREWNGTNIYSNIEIARRIMLLAIDGITGGAAFLKNQDQIFQKRDLEKKGIPDRNQISFVS